MRISKYIHSCLLVEDGGDKLLFDPGKFSFVEKRVAPDQFRDLTAVLLTHGHPDHVEWDALAQIVKCNPAAVVLTNSQVQEQMKAKQMAASTFETGTRTIGSFQVTAMDAPHAWILGSHPPQNTAYLVNGVFLNPGGLLRRMPVRAGRHTSAGAAGDGAVGDGTAGSGVCGADEATANSPGPRRAGEGFLH